MADKTDELRAVLKIARDHLEQYRAYSDEMCKIGRGCMILSPYQPDTLATFIREALKDPQQEEEMCPRCGEAFSEHELRCNE